MRFIFLPSADRQLGPLLLAHNKFNVTCVKCRPKVVLWVLFFLSFFFFFGSWRVGGKCQLSGIYGLWIYKGDWERIGFLKKSSFFSLKLFFIFFIVLMCWYKKIKKYYVLYFLKKQHFKIITGKLLIAMSSKIKGVFFFKKKRIGFTSSCTR
jgi:hypothetical protein